MPEPPPSLSFPVLCETCHATLGFPYNAGTMQGVTDGIRIGIRCRGCGATWSLEVQMDTKFFHSVDADRTKP